MNQTELRYTLFWHQNEGNGRLSNWYPRPFCCHKVVKDGSRAQYEQNRVLMAFLLSPGDTIIAEASPRDRKWGIGLGEKRAAQMEPEEWRGKNLLGKILMELREEFRNRGEWEE